ITDAEHVVRNCCDYQLNKESLKIIASIKYIAHNFDIPIDEASALLGPLTYLGRGNSERPDDIFNRSFNGPRSEFEASYIQAPLYSIPTYFESYTRLSFQDDVLALDNKPYRQRIARSLGVSEQQLQSIIQGFRLRANRDIEDQNQHNQLWTSSAEEASLLATMLRFTRLTRLLELSADELFIMFDILERDPSIHSEAEAEIFIDFESLEWNCYLILQHGKTNELLWLVQRLNQLAHWSRENNLAVEDLLKITLGRNHEIVNPEPKSDSSKVTSKDEKELSATLQFFNNLYQRMKSSLLNPESYAAETQDPRLSTKIYEAVRHQKNILVNAEDVRLVHKNDSAMKQVAYKVITQLDEVRATDFLGLNLREKYAEKIYSNLRLMGVLDSDGMLDSKLMSESETDFNLETDFFEFKLPLFNLIADIIQNEDDASVFPSDLKALSLNEAELEELYNNLIFNAYIDDQGEILQPSIFESMDNLSLFEIQSDISDYAPIIYQLLMKKLRVFAATKITISGDLFAELPLTEAETINLVQNLKFNDYINEKNQLNDNQQLLEVNADLLLLDIRFYPQRQAILDTLQAQIGKIKRDILKITIHDMIDVSDQIVADLTYRIIAGQFLEKGQISKSNREYFLAQEQDENFDILWSFDPNDNRMVFERLQSILRTSDEYKLNASLLEPFDFSLEEVEELQNILAEMKFLNDKYIPQFDKIIYFLTVENALQFTIPGFEDFNKDVFFILNSLARKLDSAISEFSALHISLCDRQQQLCYQALGDALGLSRQAIETITQRVFSITENMTDEWLLPILASVNEIDRIESLPKPSRFNIGYRRVNQFAKLVQTLSLGAEEIDVAFADQELVDKFPIPIELPVITDKTGENYQLNTIDALLESADGQIYLFKSARNTIANDYARVWIYSSTDAKALSSESDKLADLLSHQSQKPLHINKVNAAFVDAQGNNVIIADGIYYFKNPNDETAVWQVKDRQWSHVDNDFLKLQRVDASFTDSAGRSFLFSNDQFVRYSQISASADANEILTIDNGYPKNIVESWSDEADNTQLAEPFSTAIDAAFHGADNNTYFF
ncbi:MAG: hemopexin repeat-containing protein, partial [Gammaproteobacteria bacterium]|nr:hemopexin repeat-containing protein [Gammaproteobacteria bacterium]